MADFEAALLDIAQLNEPHHQPLRLSWQTTQEQLNTLRKASAATLQAELQSVSSTLASTRTAAD